MIYMKIFFIFFFIFFSNSYAKEITFICKISEEVENGEPVKKKNYEQTPIYLYLNKHKNWLNDEKKNNLINKEKDLINRISFNLIEKKKFFVFKFINYQTVNKQKIESSSFIKLNRFDGFMTFLKSYYDINERVFFTTEVRGICNDG